MQLFLGIFHIFWPDYCFLCSYFLEYSIYFGLTTAFYVVIGIFHIFWPEYCFLCSYFLEYSIYFGLNTAFYVVISWNIPYILA